MYAFAFVRENGHASNPSTNSDTTTLKDDDSKPAIAKMDPTTASTKDKKVNKKKELLFGCIPLHAIKAFWSQPSSAHTTAKDVDA
jgi:hypothetical protein